MSTGGPARGKLETQPPAASRVTASRAAAWCAGPPSTNGQLNRRSALGIVNIWVDGSTGRRVEAGKAFSADRWYLEEDSGKTAVGVSAVINMLPKPALTSWAAKMAAIFVADNIESVTALARSDRDAAIDLIKGAPWRKSGRAADAGTEVHHYTEKVAQAILDGGKPKGVIPPGMMPFLKQYVRFLTEMEVRPFMLETVVWNENPDYAGRFDLCAYIKGVDGLVIIDTKSGASGVWESAALQQTAYAFAEWYYDEAEQKLKPMPEIVATYGLWLRPEGWALHPLDSTEEEWDEFKRLHGSYMWKMQRSKHVVKPAINEIPLKRKWRGRNAA